MKTYKCIKTVTVPNLTEPQADESGEYVTAFKGSVWYLNNERNPLSDYIHLTDRNDNCLDVSPDFLMNHFEEYSTPLSR